MTSAVLWVAMTEAELGKLYERYGYLVHRRCVTILGTEHDADDALQETFARVQKYSPVNVTSMMGWLYGVAARVCFDQLRAQRRTQPWPERLLTPLRELWGGTAENPAESSLSLGSLLASLDERSREIAVLHFLDGMTQEEIAAHTGYSRKTIGVKLKAAAQTLREAFISSHCGGESCPSR